MPVSSSFYAIYYHMNLAQYLDDIFRISSDEEFELLSLYAFHHQIKHNTVYRTYVNALNIDIPRISSVSDIPFLPVSFFKQHAVLSSDAPVQKIFRSSGTTGTERSSHHITDLLLYNQSINKGFAHAFGPVSDYAFLCVLPSYTERDDASLAYMAQHLINQSRYACSHFHSINDKALPQKIQKNEKDQIPTIILGVTFALLDLAELYSMPLKSVFIIETGGMKGRRKEMIREEVHAILKDAFHLTTICSEYGMTELLSQAYMTNGEYFVSPPWMQIRIREIRDPFIYCNYNQSGGVNIIDLANINSCCFIETEDLGIAYSPHSFNIIGRIDASEQRGCNLMIS